ncbi:MAG: DnaA regulatory inactivator Hda [Burkholderiaceae bacterium]|uniref:DnaA regulatory inactivator Hda n=1 Tax=Paucibacter sp. KCTC 42545 TaxID=1768242 RepID=UPI000733A787|nr:DnaA regulatory inactivator Hda [Paucibacter sp. KCTC 42545]ALT77514.1 DnaA regulatory inactivator Hda [Paucibacter sp. KCTC 42545]MBY0234334.1 DnaA regulatory inactivator Hda [Burkholderiaceae bacterium]
MKQIPLAIGPEPVFTFDNFLPGANAVALAQLEALRPGMVVGAGVPPVFVWGRPGCGKTHLLKALAESWQAAGLQVGWYDADTPLPWELPSQPSLLLLDDCERFDAGQQHAAFALFVEAASYGLTLVATGSAPPVDLDLREDLRTRLGWGPTYELLPLSEEEMRAALHLEAGRRGIQVSDDVIDYLLTRFARDLKQLMRLLTRLDEFAMSTKRAVTVPLLRQMLADEGMNG